MVSEHLEELDESIIYFNLALQIYISKDDKSSMSKIYNNMASVYKLKEVIRLFQDLNNALDSCQKALALRITIYGYESLQTIEIQNNLAFLYEELHDYNKALQLYNSILKVRLKIFSQDQLSIARTYSNIAIIFLMLEKYDLALENQLEALEIRSIIASDSKNDIFDLGENLYNIGYIYKKL